MTPDDELVMLRRQIENATYLIRALADKKNWDGTTWQGPNRVQELAESCLEQHDHLATVGGGRLTL